MPAHDYEYIVDAIRYIEAHSARQPPLSEIAAAVGLSEFHFQRLFTRWAGISPKRFQRFLTLEHAKRLLRESRSLLDATYEAGLSSTGRLHDLFVTIESVTPGEYKSGGAGLEIVHGRHATPFGDCVIAATPRGICAISFVTDGDDRQTVIALRRSWPGARITEHKRATAALARRVFGRPDKADGVTAPIAVVVKGTNFQINVWRALLGIPLGAVVSYEDLAKRVGAPRAPRAVGNAVGQNPIAFLIPCHRVIRKTGEFGNYGGGVERKRAMLAWEFGLATPQPAEGGAATAD
jgi:AraC family transcriptional regulator of adaptative response/methylated-DNA-[protein]-cysteine methyltransferase